MVKAGKEVKEVKKRRGRDDYIRVIYELDGEDGKGVKSVEIARRLSVSKASVAEMVRKLAGEKLLKVKPYSNMHLTARGKKMAERLFDRHGVIKEFLMKFFKFKDMQAYDEAHRLEHAFSDEAFQVLEGFVRGKIKMDAPSYIG